ncbi:hypothetical protein A2348_03080 [Candidatus Uhrbacteria bacterium RIFOXYB12_FULL_58_10]|uniref:VWFA domain-containing protein n=1 Tax=Candidatus Uhrbacteria bacterium RIFOXYB2_FULL_57_15 TaxID=1802422 RepID=A0A1F7W758_9BACT|nr:MAG: hypothetical protein A2348_03080 [Candidatus Uhrbacteria bacterium RIFOXYB12_FULL_58_10]OGL97944.1 MAG: hypothetical protein A2304_05320 [Candidatus Uhrbacteria bacterium RIFOXYB2_FULL_57_15]
MSDHKFKRPAPLDRKKVAPQLVTSADAFSLMQYDERRRDTPALGELEANGRLPGMPAVLADLAFSLWAHEPGVKDEVPADRRYWRDLLGQTVDSSAFKSLSAQTRADWFMSTLGTIEASREILELVPDEDAQELENIAQAQAQADELEQAAQQAQAQAEAFEAMLAQMTQQPAPTEASGAQAGQGSGSGQPQPGQGQGQPGQGQGQPGQGQGSGLPQPGAGTPSGASSAGGMPLTADQAQRLADELAKQKVTVGEARELADLAKAEANAKADALMGQPGSAQAEAKLTELRRLGMGAMLKAQEKVGDIADTIRAWGLEPGELNRMPVPEALGLLERMRRNSGFKEFTKLLGRLRAVAKKAAKSKDKGEQRQVPRRETGRDISRALPSELTAYAIGGALRAQMLQRWSRGELKLRATETQNKPKGKGPVVVCRDSSGSMAGERQRWATGTHLALASYAKVQNRAFGSIIFDTRVAHSKVFKAGAVGARDLLEIVETHTGGGTNFEAPLRGAMKMIDDQGLSKADIVFITDGECAVSEVFLREFLAWKRIKEVSVIAVIVDDHAGDATVRQFADRVERASSFTADEAESKVFAHLS